MCQGDHASWATWGEILGSFRLEKPLSPTMKPALPRELTFKDDTKVRRKGDVYEQKWGEGFMKLFHFGEI